MRVLIDTTPARGESGFTAALADALRVAGRIDVVEIRRGREPLAWWLHRRLAREAERVEAHVVHHATLAHSVRIPVAQVATVKLPVDGRGDRRAVTRAAALVCTTRAAAMSVGGRGQVVLPGPDRPGPESITTVSGERVFRARTDELRQALGALAAALPVVAPDSPEARELLGDAALIVPSADVDAAIRRVASSAVLRSALIARGKQRALQFAWADSARAVERIYQGLRSGCGASAA